MTYLEFYQAWLDLVKENTNYHDVSDTKCFKYSIISSLIIYSLVIIISDYEIIIKFIFIIFTLMCSFIGYELYTYKGQFSWTEYPEKDYTVKEFQENMTRIGQKASPEQIELAKTVFENCLKNLPSDYQVNHSSIVRRCITNVDTETIFRSKDVEIYKNNSIKKLRNIH